MFTFTSSPEGLWRGGCHEDSFGVIDMNANGVWNLTPYIETRTVEPALPVEMPSEEVVSSLRAPPPPPQVYKELPAQPYEALEQPPAPTYAAPPPPAEEPPAPSVDVGALKN